MLFQETHPGEWPSIRETKCKNLVLPRACLGVLIPVWSSWISHTAWFLCEEPGNFLMHYLSSKWLLTTIPVSMIPQSRVSSLPSGFLVASSPATNVHLLASPTCFLLSCPIFLLHSQGAFCSFSQPLRYETAPLEPAAHEDLMMFSEMAASWT